MSDILGSAGSSSIVMSLSNRATGSYTSNTVLNGVGQRAILVDVNVDGRLDVVSPSGFNLKVALGNGSGGFGAPTTIAVGISTGAITAGDIDGNGSPDLILGTTGSSLQPGSLLILRNDGLGVFAAPSQLNVPSPPRDIALGDFNGDGALDIVSLSPTLSNAGATVFFGNGAGGFSPPSHLLTHGFLHAVGIGDIDADGVDDIVLSNSVLAVVQIAFGKPSGPLTVDAEYAAAASTSSVEVVDMNADGRLDIVMVARFGGVLVLFQSTSSSSSPVPFHEIIAA